MDYQERLKTAISEGQSRVEEQRRLDGEFHVLWEQVRDKVAQLMDHARPSLERSLGPASFPEREEQEDGDCTALYVRYGRAETGPVFVLKFCAEPRSRRILYKVLFVVSEGPDKGRVVLTEQSFSPEKLVGGNAIEDKIVDFVDAIYRHLSERRDWLARPASPGAAG